MARYAPPAADYNGTPYVPTVLVWTTPFYFDGQTLQHVTVDVRWATAEPVAQRLAGTVDNRDGYQTVEAAQRVARTCADLLKAGVTTTYDLASWSDRTAGVTLEWQQSSSRTHYCVAPRVTASGDENVAAWEVRVGLVRWLEKLAGGRLDDPRDLLLALKKRKGIALLSWKARVAKYGESYGGGGWVAADWDTVLAALPVPARAVSEAA
jgi:hypothetical protein